MHDKISNALEDNKNFWKEMRKIGLLPAIDSALQGFSPEELNSQFSYISVCSLKDPTEFYNTISTASPDGLSFYPVTVNDVILAVAYFQSQATGEDGIPHSIVAKALPAHLAELFSVSLVLGLSPSS